MSQSIVNRSPSGVSLFICFRSVMPLSQSPQTCAGQLRLSESRHRADRRLSPPDLRSTGAHDTSSPRASKRDNHISSEALLACLCPVCQPQVWRRASIVMIKMRCSHADMRAKTRTEASKEGTDCRSNCRSGRFRSSVCVCVCSFCEAEATVLSCAVLL